MKYLKNIQVMLSIILFSLSAQGQGNIAFINEKSEWFYEVHPFIGCFPCTIQFQNLKIVGDTTIQSKKCFILEKFSPGNICDDMGSSKEYLYQKDQTLYWYNKHINEFTILYNFAANKGDTWEIKVSTCSFTVQVDSISSISVDGFLRKVLYVSDEGNFFSGSIIEQIGHTKSMFPKDLYYNCDELACDSDFINGLRCYLDNGEIKYKKGEIGCDSIYQNIPPIGNWKPEFSFWLYFEDSKGNKDSLHIGYDLNGSRDRILSQFNEVNIADTLFKSGLDVRITNQSDINMGGYNHPLYHTKNKTIRYYCSLREYWFTENPYVNIDISTKNWPVTVNWNKDAFQDECLSGSLYTPMHPRGWWDTGNEYSNFMRILMKDQNQHSFTENYPSNWAEYPNNFDHGNYYSIDGMENPIATFKFAFGDSAMISLGAGHAKSITDIMIYPNPTTGKVFLSGNSSFGQVVQVYALDITGKRFALLRKSDHVDLSHLDSGLYVISIVFSDGHVMSKKMLKK